MTLQELFNVLSSNKELILYYYAALLLITVISALLSRGKAHLSPWKFLFSGIVYLVIVPGVFTVFLNIYLFGIKGQDLMKMDLYTQALPIIAIYPITYIVKQVVQLRLLPGFEKLTSLLFLIFVIIGGLWILDRTQILAFTYLPFPAVLLLMIFIMIMGRLALNRIFK